LIVEPGKRATEIISIVSVVGFTLPGSTMETPLPPWQPITFGGVAAFSRASFGRLLVVQLIVASLVAASVLCFLVTAWFPVIQKALSRLPERGAIRRGHLEWSGPSPAVLTEGTFLSIIVDAAGHRQPGQSADVQLVLGPGGLKVCSLFGCVGLPYPKNWTLALNRAEAEPWWGAWRPFLPLAIAPGVVLCLLTSWLALATVYALPLRMLAFYSDRQVTGPGCWRIACAAQLPGALLMSCAMLLYGFNRLNLVGLLFAWLLHLVIGWIYLGIVPARLPRLAGAPRRRSNPFGGEKKKKFGS
jgi:hypothetical protein